VTVAVQVVTVPAGGVTVAAAVVGWSTLIDGALSVEHAQETREDSGRPVVPRATGMSAANATTPASHVGAAAAASDAAPLGSCLVADHVRFGVIFCIKAGNSVHGRKYRNTACANSNVSNEAWLGDPCCRRHGSLADPGTLPRQHERRVTSVLKELDAKLLRARTQ